jgi:hypothetical protein
MTWLDAGQLAFLAALVSSLGWLVWLARVNDDD